MSCVSIPSSFAIFNSMSTISIPKTIAAFTRHAKINGNGRSASLLTHRTPRLGFQPSGLHAAATTVDDTSKDARPHIVTFTPSTWEDLFSTFSYDDQLQQKYCEEIETLKKEVRSMLMASTSSTKLMVLIDTLERLGLAYHFETEIEDKLKQIYDSCEEDDDNDDLFTTALRFRLLRQHQYHVSCDVFEKFVDIDNKLKEGLSSDVEGLLSFYEAAHVRIHNENILDEAAIYTTHQLSRMLPHLESPVKEKVQQALNYPLHTSVAILTLRFRIDIYENDDSKDELLLRFAKLNFNFMQNILKNDVFHVAKWWNKFDLKSKLPYFRDRLMECSLWAMSYHSEPQYSNLRILMLKLLMVFTVFDDTYDNYATLKEIEIFTEALQRWNMEEIDVLPDYLKVVYNFFMSFTEDLKHEAEKEGKTYIIPYFIEGMKRSGKAYAEEQKWIMEAKMKFPSFEEYMIHCLDTSMVYMTLFVTATVIKSSTKETMDWALSDSDIFKAAADINRLRDDLASYERESKDGTMPTCMDYYMKDKGVSMQEARCALRELIDDRWKDMNAAWVDLANTNSNSYVVPKEIGVQLLNIGRASEMTYKDEMDGFTYPQKNMAPLIAALFQDSLLV